MMGAMKRMALQSAVILLALASSWPACAVDLSALQDGEGLPTPFGLQVLEAFHGKDLKGKNGPLRKLGMDLIVAFHEFGEFQLRGGPPRAGRPFRPGNPLLRVHDEHVVIDAVASHDAETLRRDLVRLGMRQATVFGRTVSGTLPLRVLGKAAALTSLQRARPAMARSRAGSVTSQGDAAMQASGARATFGVDGSGVMVGTLSDSYDCTSGGGGAAGDVSSGDLPSGVTVLEEIDSCSGAIDEGRAMMQIIHDIAPGSTQAFHTAFNGSAGFASGIVELANWGADIINDDIIYYAEPMFQDGPIAQAVDTVRAMGVAYFSAAGNNARDSYEDSFRNSGVGGYFSGSVRHDFDAGGAVDTLQQITIGSNETVVFSFQWSDPHFSVSGSPGAASDLDIFLYSDQNRPRLRAYSINDNTGGDPVEVFAYSNIGPAQTFLLGIDLYSGPAPATIKYVYFGNLTINEHETASATAYGHANAAGARAVGAARYTQTPAFGTSPPVLESFSSAGGIPTLFDSAGAPVSELRQKPEIVAPDGVDTTFFYPGQDYEPNGFPNFFGTSAAAPHAAGAAALLRDFDPTLTADALYSALQSTALDMGAAGVDFDSGYGLIQADAALASLDNDGDGVPDSADLCPATAPGDPVDADGCSDFQKDTDGDGLSDGLENQLGTDPLVDADYDSDGLTDYREVAWDGDATEYDPLGDLNPLADDTDADGFKDGMEDTAGYDPLRASSFPVWGDIDDDRDVDTGDVLLATRAVLGHVTLDSGQLARGNVAPLVAGTPQPPLSDAFNGADLLLILRKAQDPTLY
jgi:hypothetical protein